MISIFKIQNAQAVVNRLLKSLSINVDNSEIGNELEKHPDYPSLLAISDVLTNFNIRNSAFRIEADKLDEVPCPFIAHTNFEAGTFVVVDKMDGQNVIVSNEKWNRHKLSAEEFSKMFAGVVLVAERAPGAAPAKTFASLMAGIKTPAITVGVALVFLAALIFHTNYIATASWQSLALTVFKTAGLVTSVLLLIQSIDSNNPLIQVLCKTQGKTNCNAILSSKAAKVFDGLSWSEVGFFYFAGTWALLLFGGGSAAIWQVLALLNFVSLPYTVYSIYYQARVAKQWCTLCCIVQALLWLEFIVLITTFSKPSLPGRVWEGLTTMFICLVSPVILWLIVKPLLLKLQQLQPLKDQLRRFKYNTELFNKLLGEQPKYAQPDEEWCIVLGNPQAGNIITMVSNPYCPPCSQTHKLLDELLEQRSDLQARIVFTANNTENDIKTPISRHLVALNEFPDKEMVKKALNDWYEQKQKNYESWAKAYPVALNGVEYHKIDKQNAWCKLAEVAATPTLLLNGYKLPDLYQLPDLKYMLE
ncbi:cysteine peptidase family C39 domain-containing protein [Mucilaginibacter gotjawali]|uniref:Vitamin K epoxide reductase family protein n=2 Tax=Mucilaginibacter gotjawali TaxID=1550579 RepID=A0A110B395_9SPHI|nr:cysteine peptidase family C39 domain-containing protein [Mucilaginibacter gotjawali]MBB3057536.1 putative membrane protein [Mucilaginibacter gotjawali]BAU55193.1 Vitamin K epoxide reductase family protein [Mucilaginibacter gotjawali]